MHPRNRRKREFSRLFPINGAKSTPFLTRSPFPRTIDPNGNVPTSISILLDREIKKGKRKFGKIVGIRVNPSRVCPVELTFRLIKYLSALTRELTIPFPKQRGRSNRWKSFPMIKHHPGEKEEWRSVSFPCDFQYHRVSSRLSREINRRTINISRGN